MSASRWLPVALWVALILAVTSVPTIPVPGRSGADKLGHFTLYFVLGLLTIRAGSGRAPSGRRVAITLLAIALFAAADEWHQRFIPERSAELADWVADVCGAAAAIATFTVFRARRVRVS